MTVIQDTCSIEDCGRKLRAHGLCNTHNERRRKGQDLAPPVRQYDRDKACRVAGCEQERRPGGDGTYCPMHKRRFERRGDAGGGARERSPFGQATWNEPNRRRDQQLKKYGLTAAEYDHLLAAQRGGCAVCATKTPGNRRTRAIRAFAVDHDHVTGQVRGLLCQGCNRAIGMLKDDPDVIAAAARYVARNRQMQLFGPQAKTAPDAK
ncbi:endonuclease VII domain-containing protein [Frankia sp. Cj3]|uniref:endonuclease VII domain-containing protein n=1 Tax=Frankia sp. Cj3 TaxID=2880976 RepID=UPI001EF60D52|nr:endonuclease VII domain-containing protein [Frankia sp. Cj3]